MLNVINNLNWNEVVEVDGVRYNSIAEFLATGLIPKTTIKLLKSNAESQAKVDVQTVQNASEYKITVKKYMTEKSSIGFDFMQKMNKDIPMPLRTMQGTIEKETPGMYYMHLHGKGEATCTCMRCHKTLTNPISKYYGIGPECMSKLGFVGVAIDDIDTIKKKLVDVEWSGWVIKSSILEKEIVNE